MSIKVIDGPLYQWDTGRWLLLTGDHAHCQQVHVAHVHHARRAVVVQVLAGEHGPEAPIPNSLLTSPEDLVAWAVDTDEPGTVWTKYGVRIPINARPRPDDYIYVPTDCYGYEQIEKMVAEAIGDITQRVDYELLRNKPKIEGVELVGERYMVEFGVGTATAEDIDALFEEE